MDKIIYTTHRGFLIDMDSFFEENNINQIDNIIFVDDAEGFNYELYVQPIFLNVLNKLKSLNSEKKLLLYTNNLNPKYKDIRHQSISYWLGKTSNKQIEINNRKFEKNFLFLNKECREHRIEIYNLFKENNLLDKCFYSFASADPFHPDYKSLEGIPIKGEGSYLEMELPVNFFSKSFVNIVTETFFHNEHFYINDSIFITEKTEKSFSAGMSFVIVSTPYFLKKLKKLGFKTFSNWWDESYDEIYDSNERLEKIKKLLLYISSWSLDKCNEIYIEMQDVLIHNQKLNEKYSKLYTNNYIIINEKNILH